MNRWQKCAWIAPALALLTVPSSRTISDDDQQPAGGNSIHFSMRKLRGH